ncbi:SAM-dependent methyltransferase [Streptomyces daghestanicus]|uniref:Uncharacterized protein n=1 Tax=Streptomyces daghestanicus TaxID=66885 RepID=A0ABQ3QCI5_9ACTN|nr:SAM-dependent methyltransferase [Streptomyces daghestanicus]GGU55827.1 hypothetical protein GCM10010259_53750 [Streptomyces daghestanicus]GHI34955.1 hypothetical protein Sdagh_66850 [Streptomyces daghestanicus]
MLGILGQVSDAGRPGELVRAPLAGRQAGSHLALSDGTGTDEALDTAVAACTTQSAHAYPLRSPERTASFLTGLEPVEPGIVPTVA